MSLQFHPRRVWRTALLTAPVLAATACQHTATHEPGDEPIAAVAPQHVPPPPTEPDGPAPHGPRRPAPPPDAQTRASLDLNAAYDALGYVTGLQHTLAANTPARATDHDAWVKDATKLYESASSAFGSRDYRASSELARASRDAALGIEQSLRTSVRTAAGTTLQAPPEAAKLKLPERGPRSLSAATNRVWNRLKHIDAEGTEAKPLVDASHTLLSQSDAAAKIGDTAHARELASAADAMSRAARHAERARRADATAADDAALDDFDRPDADGVAPALEPRDVEPAH
jgi:hypothetical protein